MTICPGKGSRADLSVRGCCEILPVYYMAAEIAKKKTKHENRYFQLTGNSEKTLKSLFQVDWK